MSKILLINVSPHEKGCTYTALSEAADTLAKNDVESEILYLGTKPVVGCIACGKCFQTGRCVFNDKVNEVLEKLDEYDGIVIGSQYWNQVHGFTPEDVRKDEEDLQTTRTLAQNMAWLLKNRDAGKTQGISCPDYEARMNTNFI